MNEDQQYNDHKLHIRPCECGNLHPQVMGDDFNADVTCDKCGKTTDIRYGTKSAIQAWNELDIRIESCGNLYIPLPTIKQFAEWVYGLPSVYRLENDSSIQLNKLVNELYKVLENQAKGL